MKDYLITIDGDGITVCVNILVANEVAKMYKKLYPEKQIKIWEFYKEV